MQKYLVKISALIFLNLFAFLLFWTILWAIFWNKLFFLIASVIISIIPLTMIMFFELKKINNQISNISKEKKYDWDSKWEIN